MFNNPLNEPHDRGLGLGVGRSRWRRRPARLAKSRIRPLNSLARWRRSCVGGSDSLKERKLDNERLEGCLR